MLKDSLKKFLEIKEMINYIYLLIRLTTIFIKNSSLLMNISRFIYKCYL